jgi:cytoskeletal protein RodZ
VGEALRRERTRKQLTLEDVSASTRISARFLKAIEAEDFAQLPGLIFARNFVRQYAAFLSLDPAPLVAMLPPVDLETAPMPQPPDRPRRSAWDPRWNSTFASLAWTILAGGAAVGAYVHFNRPAPSSAATAPAPVAPAKVVTAAPPSAQAAPITPVSERQTPAEPAPQSTPPQSHPVAVVVKARQDAWVQATADGKTIFATTLKAGETRPVDADGWVKIRTGNAGGVEISLNGKPIDSLGPEGQIRSVMLTADGPRPVPSATAPQIPPPETSPL